METIHEEVTHIVNGVDLKKLEATIEAINGNPDLASFRFHVTNEWEEGAKSRTVVDRFESGPETVQRSEPFVIASDEPEVLLGSDTAPNPIVAVLHALASCLSRSIIYTAAVRSINIDKLTIKMEGDVDLHGFLGLSSEVRPGFQDLRVDVDLHSSAPRQKLEELIRYIQKISPVLDSLRNRIPVEIGLK